ncbi:MULTISPECIES: Bug family tripartite tricarboxylate transporter substrate binding protein [Bordetella]|uniref:MFS transporter n=2 Tax=Bordetella TaxID=517 RepID=A0A261W0M3_9BORD|nr:MULTISPECIES: tripartite tricarboxylate transporter substrate binding protein [Bordetella]MDM9560018.1 tripartite tricarboxylate transporter substrate binding protein [Bordetella petrii]OZI79123.1 MFS transporter [Bordetella genomosp. 2]
MHDPQRRRLMAALGAAWAAASLPVPARAAKWPERPVNFIVPFPPGGPVDTTARFTTQPLGELWKVPTVVDNKAGAGGIVGAQAAVKAPADGYHYFFASIHHAVLPSLRANLSYDVMTDFTPVGMAAVFPIVLVVHESLPVNNVQELIAYARQHPGKLSFSSSGTGGGTHLAGELFNSMTGTRIQHVPYRGSAPAMQDLLGGQVQMMFADGPSAMPHLSGGKIRPLGVGNPEPSALFPGIPTIAASGVPGYEAYSWSGVLAPAGTPADTIKRVNADMARVLADPATVKGMLAAGAEPRPGTPEQFGAFLQAELDKWSKVIKQAGIKVE